MAACSADGAPALQSLAESPPVRQRWPAALADSKRGGYLRRSVKRKNAGSGRNQAELLRTLSPWLFALIRNCPGDVQVAAAKGRCRRLPRVLNRSDRRGPLCDEGATCWGKRFLGESLAPRGHRRR